MTVALTLVAAASIASESPTVAQQTESFVMESFPADVERIVRVAGSNGHEIDKRGAYLIWHSVSQENWAANWLKLSSYDNELWAEMRKKF